MEGSHCKEMFGFLKFNRPISQALELRPWWRFGKEDTLITMIFLIVSLNPAGTPSAAGENRN